MSELRDAIAAGRLADYAAAFGAQRKAGAGIVDAADPP
jgi:hypothetical protein